MAGDDRTPSSEGPSTFACPACQARYQWQASQASRRVRCRCGTVIRIPAQAGAAVEVIEAITPRQAKPTPSPAVDPPAAVFELDLVKPTTSRPAAAPLDIEPAITPHAPSRCSACGRTLSPSAVLCVNCGHKTLLWRDSQAAGDPDAGQSIAALIPAPPEPASGVDKSAQLAREAFDRVQRKYDSSRSDEAYVVSRARFVDVILPLILIAVGALMLVIELMEYTTESLWGDVPLFARALVHVANIGVNFVFLFLGVLFVARLFGNAVGSLIPTLLKISALAVFCVACDAWVYWGLDVITEGFASLGGYVRLIARIVVFFPLAGLLLGLEFLELVVLFLFARMLPMVVMFFLATIVYALFE